MSVILMIDPLLTRSGEAIASGLGERHRVVDASGAADDELQTWIASADVLLTALRRVDAALLHRAQKLRMVAKPGTGVDNIDLDAARRRGIVVTNVVGVRGQAVAEHAIHLTLALARRAWAPTTGMHGGPLPLDLHERTLGLLGLGDIGTRVARAGAGLGMSLIASTPSRRLRDARLDLRFVDLEELIAASHVLILCAPLTEATRGLVGERAISAMPTDAILVNVARGAIVQSDALARAMSDGHLHGAGLDVTDPEPLPAAHPLRKLPNVILTPHLAGRSVGAQRAAVDRMVANVRAFLDGDEPPDRLV